MTSDNGDRRMSIVEITVGDVVMNRDRIWRWIVCQRFWKNGRPSVREAAGIIIKLQSKVDGRDVREWYWERRYNDDDWYRSIGGVLVVRTGVAALVRQWKGRFVDGSWVQKKYGGVLRLLLRCLKTETNDGKWVRLAAINREGRRRRVKKEKKTRAPCFLAHTL